MKIDYRKTKEFEFIKANKDTYHKSLELQQSLSDIGVAWHNILSDECTHDFSCCKHIGDYSIRIPSQKEFAKDLLEGLFLECEHGDENHRKWLKDKFNSFLNQNFY